MKLHLFLIKQWQRKGWMIILHRRAQHWHHQIVTVMNLELDRNQSWAICLWRVTDWGKVHPVLKKDVQPTRCIFLNKPGWYIRWHVTKYITCVSEADNHFFSYFRCNFFRQNLILQALFEHVIGIDFHWKV